jgi:hypothetical protein
MKPAEIVVLVGLVLCCATMTAWAAVCHSDQLCSGQYDPRGVQGCHDDKAPSPCDSLLAIDCTAVRGFKVCVGHSGAVCKDGNNWVCQFTMNTVVYDPQGNPKCYILSSQNYEWRTTTCNRFVF